MPEDSPRGSHPHPCFPKLSITADEECQSTTHILPVMSEIKGWAENWSQLPIDCDVQIHIIAVCSYIWKTKGMQT